MLARRGLGLQGVLTLLQLTSRKQGKVARKKKIKAPPGKLQREKRIQKKRLQKRRIQKKNKVKIQGRNGYERKIKSLPGKLQREKIRKNKRKNKII